MSRKPLKHGPRFQGRRMETVTIHGMPLGGMKRRRPSLSMEKRFLMALRTARYKSQLKAPSKVKLSFLEDDHA